jgi:hypothetical protein
MHLADRSFETAQGSNIMMQAPNESIQPPSWNLLAMVDRPPPVIERGLTGTRPLLGRTQRLAWPASLSSILVPESGKGTLPTVAYMLNDTSMWDSNDFDSMPESRRRCKRPEGEKLTAQLRKSSGCRRDRAVGDFQGAAGRIARGRFH